MIGISGYRILGALFVWAVVLSPAAAMAQGASAERTDRRVTDGRDLPVREHVLENGMRFLVLPRAGAPTVTFVLHVAVGSVSESLGATGATHFVEHLLFKGSTTIGTTDIDAERILFSRMDATHDTLLIERGRRPAPNVAEIARLEARIEALEDSARVFVVPNEFDRIFAGYGARGLNASTSLEATQYFVSLPSNRAELWFAMEADRMRNPVFREFYAERDVIAEERRSRIDASPAGLLYEEHLAAAFRVHPYGVSPTGHLDDILSISRSAVLDHYERYYGPGNTTIAIVGDIDPDTVTAWADRYFGGIPGAAPPPPLLTREPVQRGERRVEVLFDAEPQVRIGWKVPAGTDPDAPALAMLANVLVAGRDSRLYRRLIREDRIAGSVTAGIGPGTLYPGLFTIQATPLAPATPEAVESTIYDELDRLRTDPPTSDEIERVRTRLEAAEVRRLTSKEGLAFQLVASQAMWGDWRETFRIQERMRSVELEDLLRVLDAYFVPERRTVATLRRAEASADRSTVTR